MSTRTSITRWGVSLAAVAVVALVAAGCGDDGDDGAASTTTAADMTTDTTTTAAGATTTAPEPTTTATTTSEAPSTTEAVDQGVVLAGRPWADPTDAFTDPVAAVEHFMAFVDDLYTVANVDVGTPVIGDYLAGDERSGEVEVTFTDEVGATGGVAPTITVFVRQPDTDGPWWVVGAASNVLTVEEPAADAIIDPAFDLAYTNTVMSGPPVLAVFADGEDGPRYEATFAGGGVFAQGDFATRIDLSSCDDTLGTAPDGAGLVFMGISVCDGPGPAGEAGTVVLVHDHAVTTVPVVFAGGQEDS